MRFKIGDKVEVTKQFLLKLPGFADRVHGGGVIYAIYENSYTAGVEFYTGCTYHIFFSSLQPVRNRQLLFDFYRTLT